MQGGSSNLFEKADECFGRPYVAGSIAASVIHFPNPYFYFQSHRRHLFIKVDLRTLLDVDRCTSLQQQRSTVGCIPGGTSIDYSIYKT